MLAFLNHSQWSVTLLWTRISPSFCWFAISMGELTKIFNKFSGTECAWKTCARLALTPVRTTSDLFALSILFSPLMAHSQLQFFFFRVVTHQMLSPRGKCGHRLDRVRPPCFSTGATIRRKKTVLINIFPCSSCSNIIRHLLSLFQRFRVFFRRSTPSRSLPFLKILLHSSQSPSIKEVSFIRGGVCVRTSLDFFFWQQCFVTIFFFFAFPSHHHS